MESPPASVIILSWNGKDYLQPCLEAVLAQDYSALEVIVVDNGSADGSADFVATHFPQVKLIRNPQNIGFAAGNNTGLRQAQGDALVLLNQDTVVRPGWLAALCAELTDSTVGIAGCKIFNADGTLQHAGGALDARGAAVHLGSGEVDSGQYDRPADAEFVTGAALALTAGTLKAIGLLDEGFYPAYYEDTDWCFRAKAAGLRVRYVPAAALVHAESASTEAMPLARKTMMHQGRLRFLLKHRPLAALQTGFLPAEQAWLSRLGHTIEMMAAREAYLKHMLSLGEMAAWRCQTGLTAPTQTVRAEWQALLHLLTTLRHTCLQREARTIAAGNGPPVVSLTPGSDHHWRELQDFWQLQEYAFRSSVPGLALFRKLWHNIAARWSDLALINQQTKVNWAVKNLMTTLAQEVGPATDQTLREINLLARRVVELEQQVAVLQESLQNQQRK